MPVYDFRCDVCGQLRPDVFKKMAGDPPMCGMCLQPMRQMPSAPAITGRTWLRDGPGGHYSKQAGRFFQNAREIDTWAEQRGLAVVSSTSREWRGVKDANKEEAQKDAKSEGFADQDDRKRSLKENSRDYVAAAAEKKMEAYHAEQGTEGRVAVEDFAKLPEAKPSVTVAG